MLLFQISGLILLVAMIGAIVLTHRQRTGTKRQNITRQQERMVTETLEIVSVRSGAGIGELGVYRRKPEPVASEEP
jgi:NADH-quinone oxidoreductase subunit J